MLIGGVCLSLTWCDLKWCLNGASMVQLPMRAHSSLLFLRMPSASIISLLRYHQKPISSISLSEREFKRKIMVLDDHGLTVDFGGMNGKYKCRQCGGFITEGYAFNVHPDVKFHPNCLKCW